MPSFREAVQRWRGRQEDSLKAAGAVRMPGGIWVTAPPVPATPKPSVDVYATHGALLIQPMARVRIGFGTPSDIVEKLADSVADDDLGAVIRRALDESAALPIRDDINRSRPERRASGLRTQREFMNGTRLVAVAIEDGKIVIDPSRNESPRSPRSEFYWIKPRRTLEQPSDAELGAATRLALADCTFAAPKRHRQRKLEQP